MKTKLKTDSIEDQPAASAPTTAAGLRSEIEQLRLERENTALQASEAERFEAENLLDASDEVLDENAQRVVRLRRKERRLGEMERQLTEKLAIAEADEAETLRVQRYEQARAAADEAERWIRQVYVDAATTISAGLVRLSEIRDLVDDANANRPSNAPRIDVEEFRALPGTPDTTSHREGAVYYVDDQGQVHEPSDEYPLTQDPSGQYWLGARQSFIKVFARSRDEAVRTPGRPRAAPTALPAAVRLPGVEYADPDFWPVRSKAWSS